ncbi:MAG TPA: hypothetical protein VNO70_21615, partial [Blastocatellia bacterium]|nr:hypothetical protein [Blastocatellia bacterium]
MKMGITVLNLSVLLLTLFPAYTIDAAASLTSANPGDKTRRTDAADAAASALTAGRSSSLLSRLPLDFIENRGQWDRDVKFMARKGSVAASFERAAIKLRLGKDRAALFSLAFEGASKRAQLVGEGKRDGHYNFFFGNDPAKWQSRVAAYSSVLYLGLYDRVDMRVREDSGRLEYDLILAAHADLEKIVIRVDGASGLEVAPDGSLLLKTAGGVFRQTPPLTWEELPTGERVPIPCHFRKVDARRYGFAAPRRDPARKLVIDPGLEWSTFLGGGGHEVVQGLALARDGSGDVILAGATTSPDFPAVGGALNAIGQAMYVTRLSAVGNSLVYSTLFGGSSVNLMIALALDASSAPVVVGSTHSTDFPTTAGAFDQTHNGEYDAFVTRFDSSGSRMVFSTLLGGSAVDEAWAVDLDGAGRVYVAGHTGSQNFPTTAGAYDTTPNALIDATFNSLQDVFVARLSETGTALAYSTYLGGQGVDYATDLAVDALGVVTLTGRTVPISSTAAPFPTTAGAVDRTLNGNDDAYIVRLRGAGAGASDLEYSTLLGGNDTDQATALALDPVKPELVTVVGWTYSGNFPVTPGALLPTHFAPTDTTLMFVTRFQFPATGGGSLVWSTYHGAPGNQQAEDVVVDDTGAAIVVGANSTRNPPTTERAFDRTPATSDGIISRISADGSQLLYSTLLGGTSFEGTMRVAYVGGATVVVAGRTRSTDFPVTPGALDTVYGADGRPSDFTVYDVFVSRMTLEPLATADMTAAPPSLVNPADGAAFTAPVFVTFDWADVADPSGVEAYHIQVSPNPTFTSDTVAQLSGWHETWVPVSQDETDFSTNFTGTFYWRVRTLDAAHNLS